MLTHYLDLFEHVATRVRPSLNEHSLDLVAGRWLGCPAIKVRRREWLEEADASKLDQAGIFFSVWVEEKGLKNNRVFYNIHALRLRNMSAFTLKSREFATAFRSVFARESTALPS